MAKDIIHDAVKNALIRDGWTITHDPFTIAYEEVNLAADLGAEKPIAAERGGQKIVVEIKSFVSRSPMQDLKVALGQYHLYLGFLEIVDPERKLYLAVSDLVYRELFKQKAIQLIVKRYQVAMVVVNVEQKEIIEWIS
jgi:hypothetical protein